MTLPRIEEWIKEAELRSEWALTMLRIISGRLQDLTGRNEELLAEDIALRTAAAWRNTESLSPSWQSSLP